MKFILLIVAISAIALSESLPTPAEILANSNCHFDESSDTVDCSGVTSVEEIVAAMGELAAAGQTDITRFALLGNNQLTYLPQSMLGGMEFQQIDILNNYALTSCSDILGASKNTVLNLDLSGNGLSYLPRMESTSLITFKQQGEILASIASNALNALPNLQVIDLQRAGQSPRGLTIDSGAFKNLPKLQELSLKDYYPKDGLATEGSFTFSSPDLRLVDLISSYPIQNSEVGAYGGFNANTTLKVLLNAAINIESFYNVFNSGAQVVVQELQPCFCNLDWLKFSCFLPQATMRCVYRGEYYTIQDVPEDNFANCCFGK